MSILYSVGYIFKNSQKKKKYFITESWQIFAMRIDFLQILSKDHNIYIDEGGHSGVRKIKYKFSILYSVGYNSGEWGPVHRDTPV